MRQLPDQADLTPAQTGWYYFTGEKHDDYTPETGILGTEYNSPTGQYPLWTKDNFWHVEDTIEEVYSKLGLEYKRNKKEYELNDRSLSLNNSQNYFFQSYLNDILEKKKNMYEKRITRIKEEIPDIIIIGADPVGSILGGGNTVEPYHVEGIGYDFFPEVLDNSLIDSYVKTNDKESFLLSRRLIKEEGLLCGGSCGSAMAAALQAATKLDENQKCLVILPDGIRNYMTKFPNDEWMISKGFKTE